MRSGLPFPEGLRRESRSSRARGRAQTRPLRKLKFRQLYLDGLRLPRSEDRDIDRRGHGKRGIGRPRRDQHVEQEGVEVVDRGEIEPRRRPVLLARIGGVDVDEAEQAAEAAERHDEDEQGEQRADQEPAPGGEALAPPGDEGGERAGEADDPDRMLGLGGHDRVHVVADDERPHGGADHDGEGRG